MDTTELGASAVAGTAVRGDTPRACPRCAESFAALPPVSACALGGVPVQRCRRCGARSTAEEPSRFVFSCDRCGVPFLAGDLLPHADRACPSCRDGEMPADLPDTVVVRAAEREVRAALAARWRFVTLEPAAEYLERIARQVARRVDGAPAASRIHLFDDPAWRTLALPSGAFLISTGTLTFLGDEAELAFVLAHEAAHAASGDAAVRLVRLGFDAVARGPEAPTPEAWAAAALDLVGLGYGRRRERDADARALEAMLALDYDPESAFRLLRRLDAAVESGDATVAELAASHPPGRERIRRLERALWGYDGGTRILRANRDVFRRAVGAAARAGGFADADLPVGLRDDAAAARGPAAPGRRGLRFWLTLAALAVLAAAATLLALR
jgi:hypothetical protein